MGRHQTVAGTTGRESKTKMKGRERWGEVVHEVTNRMRRTEKVFASLP